MSRAIRGATQRATVGKPTGVFEQAVSGKRTAGSPAVARGSEVGAGATAGLPAVARGSEVSERVGGSNSVVESQPSKLLVAGSIPVSRSNLRSREFRASYGWQANLRPHETRASARPLKRDLSTEARSAEVEARGGLAGHPSLPMVNRWADVSAEAESERRCSSVGRARPW